MNNITEKRNFCLMLSLPSGQEFAQKLGLTPPSKDVQELEQLQIDNQWDLLNEFGIFDEISESVEWFTEILSTNMDGEEMPPMAAIEGSKAVLISFGMALIQKLLENQMIVIISPLD